MSVYTFAQSPFAVEGDPEAVRETSRAYGRFATTAAEAATSLRGLDSSTWVGTEGDLFRARVAQIPPHLDTAHTAFAQVARALEMFAEELAAAQRQMAGVRADAEQTFQALQGARVQRTELQPPTAEQVQADPPAQSAYEDLKQELDNRVGQLDGAFDGHLEAATGIHARVQEAARQAGTQIRAAGRTSPTANPLGLLPGWENLAAGGFGASGLLSSPASQPPPPAPEPEPKKGGFWRALGHGVLDVAGLIPVIGEPADGINAAWYTAEGDYVNAGLSAAGMIPFLGWGGTAAKFVRKGAKAVDDASGATLAAQKSGVEATSRERFPDWLRERLDRGRAFNEENWHRFPANEVTLDSGKRLDSYVPDVVIASRKFSQLAAVQAETAVGYLREAASKYSPGEVIADTPHNRAHFPDLIGEELQGTLVLEVPPQTAPVPERVLAEARRLGIMIQDVNGRLYP